MADISKIKLPNDSNTYNVKDVYARSIQYTATLTASKWSNKTYTLSLTNLACGSDGTVSPIITYTSNQEEYSYIDSAVATPGTGITFTASTTPTKDIGIVIIDNK